MSEIKWFAKRGMNVWWCDVAEYFFTVTGFAIVCTMFCCALAAESGPVSPWFGWFVFSVMFGVPNLTILLIVLFSDAT